MTTTPSFQDGGFSCFALRLVDSRDNRGSAIRAGSSPGKGRRSAVDSFGPVVTGGIGARVGKLV